MRWNSKITAAIVIFCTIRVITAQGEEILPLHQERLSDRALVVWTGDAMQMIKTVALATNKGLVVIETSLIRSYDARIRAAIEKEFDRDDFKYLINTHYHHDHTAGNQIYADATIIGHKNLPAGMHDELTGGGLVKLIEKFKGMQVSCEEELEKLEPGTQEHTFTKEFLICLKLAIEELGSGLVPTYPGIVFEKNLTIDMGDMTLELYSMGGMHTDSDIAVFVPEEGLVAVGDVMPERWIPRIRKEIAADFSTTLENWGRIVDGSREITHVNMAHSDMYLSVETFQRQHAYLQSLWLGLSEMRAGGQTLEDARARYSIKNDFPYFYDERSADRRDAIHENNLEVIWDLLKGK